MAEKQPKNVSKSKEKSTKPLPVPEFPDNNYIYQTNWSTPCSRVVIVIDYIMKRFTQVPQGAELFLEEELKDIINLFTSKYNSKIIYGLSMMNMSSAWELSLKLNLSRYKVKETLNSLVSKNLVHYLTKDHHMNEVMKRYWKETFPNTRKKPELYILNPLFEPVVESYHDYIFQKYITSREYNIIKKRKEAFSKYYTNLKKQVELIRKREEESIGRCNACGKLITKDSVFGKGYHKFKIGLICNTCKRAATIEVMRTWMQKR